MTLRLEDGDATLHGIFSPGTEIKKRIELSQDTEKNAVRVEYKFYTIGTWPEESNVHVFFNDAEIWPRYNFFYLLRWKNLLEKKLSIHLLNPQNFQKNLSDWISTTPNF